MWQPMFFSCGNSLLPINFVCATPCAVPAEQGFATCASPGGKMQTTILATDRTTAINPQTTVTNPQTTANLQTTGTDSLTDHQTISLNTVRTVVVPILTVLIMIVTGLVVVIIIILYRGRSRKRIQGIHNYLRYCLFCTDYLFSSKAD